MSEIKDISGRIDIPEFHPAHNVWMRQGAGDTLWHAIERFTVKAAYARDTGWWQKIDGHTLCHKMLRLDGQAELRNDRPKSMMCGDCYREIEAI